MAGQTEVELKWALSPESHAELSWRLPDLLGSPARLEQENRFFDAADGRLRRAEMSVRLRREDGRVLLTCKRRLPRQHGAHRNDEWERWLDLDIWKTLDAPDLASRLPLPEHVRAALLGAPLAALGGFANLRLEWHHGDELVCLDRTDLGKRVDHELEIETPDPARSSLAWSERLAHWRVAWTPQERTKLARYLALNAGD
jgi:uncharacterized protein YjbK